MAHATSTLTVRLVELTQVFLKLGVIGFGGPAAHLALMEEELVRRRARMSHEEFLVLRNGLVERYGWLTESQLLDAVAVGQITPGPVFTTATFIGYLLGGWPASLVATIGIFLPAFCFVAISGPLVPRIRQSRIAGAFLDGVNAASLALMGTVTVQLMGAVFFDGISVAIGLAAAALLLFTRINSAWLMAGGVLIGLWRLNF